MHRVYGNIRNHKYTMNCVLDIFCQTRCARIRDPLDEIDEPVICTRFLQADKCPKCNCAHTDKIETLQLSFDAPDLRCLVEDAETNIAKNLYFNRNCENNRCDDKCSTCCCPHDSST